jgi:hypothetical protein
MGLTILSAESYQVVIWAFSKEEGKDIEYSSVFRVVKDDSLV